MATVMDPSPKRGSASAPIAHSRDLDTWVVADTLRRRPSAIFTDIDGTISPIVPTPSEASVDGACRESLRALVPHLDLLCVLTGRPADEAWRMVRIDEALYVGNHGAERWYRGELLRPPGTERYHARLARAQAMLRLSLANVPGLVFEDKGIGMAVHFRHEPSVGSHVLRVARDIATRRGLDVIERTGHIEVRVPIAGDKGTSLGELVRSYGLRGVVVFGDDPVDVPAFAAAREYTEETGGASVVVTVGDTLASDVDADVRLGSPAETCRLLSAVAGALGS